MKASERFLKAFDDHSGTCHATCACGRVFFNFMDAGCFDGGTLAALEKMAELMPDRVTRVDHAIGFVAISGVLYVDICECGTAAKYEAFLQVNSEKIAAYMREYAKDLREKADAVDVPEIAPVPSQEVVQVDNTPNPVDECVCQCCGKDGARLRCMVYNVCRECFENGEFRAKLMLEAREGNLADAMLSSHNPTIPTGDFYSAESSPQEMKQEPEEDDQALLGLLSAPGTLAVPVTQFLRPNGRRRMVSVGLPKDAEPAYDDMTRHDCCFEVEILGNGVVSATISDGEQDVDISLTENGHKVAEGMVEMLKRARWRNKQEEDPNG